MTVKSKAEPSTRKELPAIHEWRTLAESFPCILWLVRRELITVDFRPQDLDEVCNCRQRSLLHLSIRGELEFLLHVWDRHAFDFELPRVLGWEKRAQKAFANWANGETLGEPYRYF